MLSDPVEQASCRNLAACRHCTQPRLLRARGLCRACFYRPTIRAKYDPLPRIAAPPAPDAPRCRGCRKPCHMHGRGLCRTCFEDPATRRQHAPWVRGGRVGLAWEHTMTAAPVLALPTAIRPGPPKVTTLANRRAAGLALFHPDDLSSTPPDLVTTFARLVSGRVSGVFAVARQDGAVWRAQPRNPRTGRRQHLGYFPDRCSAAAAVVQWRNAGYPQVNFLPRSAG